MSSLLQIRDLSVKFRAGRAPAHAAVKSVSIDVGAAEIVGLMGESGSGKTTVSLAEIGRAHV